MPGKSSIGFNGFEKLTFLFENFENFEKIRKRYKSIEGGAAALRFIRAGTRLTVTARCHTETVAKRARVGPRTQILLTMKKFVWVEILSTSARLSDMIVLDNVLKTWMELIKY